MNLSDMNSMIRQHFCESTTDDDEDEDDDRCECGSYINRNISRLSNLKCMSSTPLSNHITFPSIAYMGNTEDPSPLYYNTETGSPKIHWALLLEMKKIFDTNDKKSVKGINQFNEEVFVYFDHESEEQPETFKWKDLKPGHTLAILYAEQKNSPKNEESEVYESKVYESNLDLCYIFKGSLKTLKDETKTLVDEYESKLNSDNTNLSCFYCGVINVKLSRCAQCKLVRYCSKKCQMNSWKFNHKKLCSQSEMLLRLAGLPNLPFEEFLTFASDDKYFIPPYTPSTEPRLQGKKSMPKEPGMKKICELCESKTKRLTTTECCGRTICDDEADYVICSFAKNSCRRNHRRYTLCGNHYSDDHKGDWKTCEKCKHTTDKDHYIYYATNAYNFEKLDIKNRPTMKCCACGFESEDFGLFGNIMRFGGCTHDIKNYCLKGSCEMDYHKLHL